MTFLLPEPRTLSEHGADLFTPSVDLGFEVRAFARDPDGHLFALSEVRPSEAGDAT